MSARRTASSIATFAALAIASFSGAAANASTLGFSPASSGFSIVIVIGGNAFAISLSGILQTGGAG